MILLNKTDVITMTSVERVVGLHTALLDIYSNNISGDIVECGVYLGGNIIISKVFFDSVGDYSRNYYCYDTFTGMTKPSILDGPKSLGWQDAVKCEASLESVKNEFNKFNILDDRVKFIVGDVCNTLKEIKPDKIAILRLDTDFYQSTKVELRELYHRLVPGGFLIIDDYGHWQGCRIAVDEFFGQEFIKNNFQFLDYTGIMYKKSL